MIFDFFDNFAKESSRATRNYIGFINVILDGWSAFYLTHQDSEKAKRQWSGDLVTAGYGGIRATIQLSRILAQPHFESATLGSLCEGRSALTQIVIHSVPRY
jgi:hypothetical protein